MLEKFIHIGALGGMIDSLLAWLQRDVLVPASLLQILLVVVAFIPAYLLARPLERRIRRLAVHRVLSGQTGPRRFLIAASGLSMHILWVVLMWLAVAAAGAAGWPSDVMRLVVSLLNAWIVIRLLSGMVRAPLWGRLVAIVVWTFVALSILDLMEPTVRLLDSVALSLGQVRISALAIVKSVLSLAVLLWAAIFTSHVFEQRINRVTELTPSVRVLLAKLLKIVLTVVAILMALSTLGIDLTAFAIFGGAVGVGLGLGLQRIVANLISGVILLLDRSIKPGDTITIGGTYGWIESLGARYASVRTRDGTEHLIPNEELITQRVENWSHTDQLVRLRTPVGISYRSDVHEAIALCVEAAIGVERVLADPPPVCLLTGFGDSSVNLELRFWITDPHNGRANVTSQVLLRIWDKFHEHGIEIPYPQRDIHLRSPDAIAVEVRQSGAGPAA
jgi:small-conductance mechanosensitive channel